ncbi:hypothetical protein CKQ90_36585, partial [Klebsiella pneumoniae]
RSTWRRWPGLYVVLYPSAQPLSGEASVRLADPHQALNVAALAGAVRGFIPICSAAKRRG